MLGENLKHLFASKFNIKFWRVFLSHFEQKIIVLYMVFIKGIWYINFLG